MKYLFQQMIAFWILILLIMTIVGFSFSSLTKQTVLDNYYNQMFAYAESIRKISEHNPESLLQNVATSELFLQDQGVAMIFFGEDEKPIYPIPSDLKATDKLLTKENWKSLSEGETFHVTKKYNYNDEVTNYAFIFQPLFLNSGDTQEFMGVLAIFQPISNIEANMDALTENLFKGFLISSLIALFVSYVLAQIQVNRINRIKKATREISQGNFDVNIEIKGNDELEELAQDFNTMAHALKESNEEIERQEDRRRQFMADAAHEMRTPLTTINGLLEGITYKAIPKDQEEKSIELMRKETNRLIRLVNENLDYEKIRTNQISMVIQKIDAVETVKGLITQLTPKAEAAGDTLELIVEDDVFVYADYDRFVQILFNITQNAIQFTENGQITITLERAYKATVVSIADTGSGMTPEERSNIWERYYKVDASRKNTKYGESGLGLSIVQQLVKLHQGEIIVESEKGVGSTFTIRFPDPKNDEVTTEK